MDTTILRTPSSLSDSEASTPVNILEQSRIHKRVIQCQSTEKKFDAPSINQNFLGHLHTANEEGRNIVFAFFVVIFGHILDQSSTLTLLDLCAVHMYI